jgi:hypothetical protein
MGYIHSQATLPYEPLEERMAFALERLADIAGNVTIAERNPRCPLSFSLTSPDVEEKNLERIYSYANGQRGALSPLRPDGWPIRRYACALMSFFHVDLRLLIVSRNGLALVKTSRSTKQGQV